MPRIILAVAIWVLLAGSAEAAMTASQFASLLKSAKIVDTRAGIAILVLSDELIVSVKSDVELSGDQMKAEAAAISKVVDGETNLKTRHLRIIFSNRANEDLVKEISIASDQLSANLDITKLTVVTGEKAETEAVHIVGSLSALSPQGKALTSGDYSPARDKLVMRIKELQTKGVGVKPFFDELSKADEYYKRADMKAASVALERVDNIVGEQEQSVKSRQKAMSTAAATAARTAPARGSVSMAASAGRGSSFDSLAEFSGSSNAYYDQVAREMLKRELGDLAPQEGPFRLERFRIAKRIQEYQARGMRVDSFKAYFKKVEDLTAAANQDHRRLQELGDNIRYLEKQLGLAELQGGAAP